MSSTQINLETSKNVKTVISTKSVESVFDEMNDVNFDLVKEKFEGLNIKVREIKNVENNLYLLISNNSDDCNQLELECNGLILEKETNKVVAMCQNKFLKITDKSFNMLKNPVYKAKYCEDGTVIRLYNYNNVWITATTKCIDARNSYWSSEKTFDNMFWEIFGDNTSSLDKNFTYSFILIHTENRIVVKHRKNELIYINRINNLTKEEEFTNPFTFPSSIELPFEIDFDNLDNYSSEYKRGLIIKFKEQDTWKSFQHDFTHYTKIKEVRGNVPMIRMRYLELLGDQESLTLLETNYTEHLMLFSMIKHSMDNLYKEIHNLYFQSHIKHSITITDKHRLYRCLKQLHGIYKKQGVVITLEEVTKKINSLDKNIIKKLLGWIR